MTIPREEATNPGSALAASDALVPLLIPDLPQTAEILPFLQEIDANRWYSNNGPLVKRFESELAAHIDAGITGSEKLAVVTTTSGTTALEVALESLQLPQGSLVGIPAFTFPATGTAVLRCGLEPVLLDVDPDTWCLDAALAREAMGRFDLAAVVPVGAFGAPLPAAAWDEFAGDTGTQVVFDAAAGLGHQPVGQRHCVTFSLHATKPLGLGEGGALATRDADLATRARELANFGLDQARICRGGLNAKMSEFHAAVGLAQLRRRPVIRRAMMKTVKRYLSGLARLGVEVGHQATPPSMLRSVLPVLLPTGTDVAAVATQLSVLGIQTRRWYYPALQGHPAFFGCARFGSRGDAALPVCDALNERLLGLPFHGRLDRNQIDFVCGELDRAVRDGG